MLDAFLAIGVSAWACQPQEGPSLETELAAIAQGWDGARYEISDENSQVVALRLLATEAQVLALRFPTDVRVRVWQGVILAGEADDADWIDALRYAGEAKQLLEASEREPLDRPNTATLETALGALYGEAPPFPISFGDARIAEAHFRRGVDADPTGIESNFYYADYLVRQHRYRDAIPVLLRAQGAPARPEREIGDQWLHRHVTELLAQARRAGGR